MEFILYLFDVALYNLRVKYIFCHVHIYIYNVAFVEFKSKRCDFYPHLEGEKHSFNINSFWGLWAKRKYLEFGFSFTSMKGKVERGARWRMILQIYWKNLC